MRTSDTVEGTSIVVNESLQNLSQACQGAMPDSKALKKMVRRQRNHAKSYPVSPTDLTNLSIPQEFKTYAFGKEEIEDLRIEDLT